MESSTIMEKSMPRQFKHFIFTPDSLRFRQDGPRPKRRRVRVACSECSARKVKCSGSRPVCQECRRNESTCVYRDSALGAPDSPQIAVEDAAAEPLANGCETVAEIANSLGPLEYPTQSSEGSAPPNDRLSTLNNWSGLNVRLDVSGTPFMVSMASPPSTFRSYPPTSALEQRSNHQDVPKIRVPYFRWFGPTGIVPGFTKVLVDLRQTESERSASTDSSPAQMGSSPAPTESPAAARVQTQQTTNIDSPLHQQAVRRSSLFESDDEIMPKSGILEHLLSIFFDYFGCHFPFYERYSFMELVKAKSVPALLLNSMCALASRFSYDPRIRREPIYLCGEIFGDKAKQLIVVVLAVPSYDLAASLLMLSWYEFGCNRDVGMWMYTGMAIRMAQDLGMDKAREEPGKPLRQEKAMSDGLEDATTNAGQNQEEDDDERLPLNLFWSIYFIDRIISLGTGRPLTLRDEQISCPLPTDLSQSDKSFYPNPFPHMIRIMTIQGKVNEEISTIRQSEELSAAKRNTLLVFQNQLIETYTHLEDRLTFNITNFRDQVTLGHGGSFLLLHVWFHAIIITLHRPGLMFGKGTIAHTLDKDSLHISMSSANAITKILNLAELIDDKTITGTPFLNQAIYIAALAFISESEIHGPNVAEEQNLDAQSSTVGQAEINPEYPEAFFAGRINVEPLISMMPPDPARGAGQIPTPAAATLDSLNNMPFSESAPPTMNTQTDSTASGKTAGDVLLHFNSKCNYEICLHAITILKLFWRGIGWIQSTMEQKARGIVRTDPSEESVDPESRIELRDAGMLKRLQTARRYRGSKATTMPSGLLYPSFLEPGPIGPWEVNGNQGWGTFELAEDEMIFGDGYNASTWSAAVPSTPEFLRQQI